MPSSENSPKINKSNVNVIRQIEIFCCFVYKESTAHSNGNWSMLPNKSQLNNKRGWTTWISIQWPQHKQPYEVNRGSPLHKSHAVYSFITLQCDILALVWLFGPANVTFWTCQCVFLALRLFPASDTLPCELKKIYRNKLKIKRDNKNQFRWHK